MPLKVLAIIKLKKSPIIDLNYSKASYFHKSLMSGKRLKFMLFIFHERSMEPSNF